MLRFVLFTKAWSQRSQHGIHTWRLCHKTGNGIGPGHTDFLVCLIKKMTWQHTLHCPLPSAVYSACLNNSLLQLNTTATTPLSGRVLGGVVLDQTGRFSCLPTIAHNPAGGTGCSKHLSTVLGLSWTHGLMVSRDPFLQLPSCRNQERPSDETAFLTTDLGLWDNELGNHGAEPWFLTETTPNTNRVCLKQPHL